MSPTARQASATEFAQIYMIMAAEDKPKRDRRKREYPCFVRIYAVDDAEMEHRYCGSTELELEERLCKHRVNAKKGRTSKFYRYMREQGPTTFSITLLNEFTANSKEEDNEAEDQAILMFGDLNVRRAVPRTKDDRRRYNKSDAGKRAAAKYLQTDAGKKARAKYRQSDAGKRTVAKYYQSDASKEVRAKYRQSDAGKRTAAKADSKYRDKPENAQPIYCHCSQRSYTTLRYHQDHKHSKRHLTFMEKNELPEL